MMIKKTLNLVLAGSFFTVGGVAVAQHTPATPQGSPQAGSPPQQQQLQLQGEPQAEQAPRQDPAEIQAKMAEIRTEVETLSLRLNEIHQQALLVSDVMESLIEYETTFNEKIRGSAPGLEEQVESHAEILESMGEFAKDDDKTTPANKAELASLLAQYNEVKQQLAPLESQLFNDPEVIEARTEYQEDLLGAMNEIEPKVEEMIQKRMDLAQSFMGLQQEYIQHQQQGAQGQAPQGQAPQQAVPVR